MAKRKLPQGIRQTLLTHPDLWRVVIVKNPESYGIALVFDGYYPDRWMAVSLAKLWAMEMGVPAGPPSVESRRTGHPLPVSASETWVSQNPAANARRIARELDELKRSTRKAARRG